jgi:translation initiation factor IF-3
LNNRINAQIKASQVRLVGLPEGHTDGLYTLQDALNLAKKLELDLIEISDKSTPPVCKIMDFSKFKFDQAKKEREKQKNQKTSVTKEIRLSQNIGEHDMEFKKRHAEEFLKRGDKVKVVLFFKGRGITFKDQGQIVLLKFAELLKETGVPESMPKLEGKQMHFIIKPKK